MREAGEGRRGRGGGAGERRVGMKRIPLAVESALTAWSSTPRVFAAVADLLAICAFPYTHTYLSHNTFF
jgi:hypothetical protein